MSYSEEWLRRQQGCDSNAPMARVAPTAAADAAAVRCEERARRLIAEARASPWAFHAIARASPKDAKDAMTSALTTMMIVSALVLTFTFPLLITPPAAMLEEEQDSHIFRTWWFFHLFSVLLSFSTIFSYTIMLLYLFHLPEPSVAPFLVLIKTPWTLSNIAFVLSITCAVASCMTAVFPIPSPADWNVGIALAMVMVVFFTTMLLYTDSWFGSFVQATLAATAAEQAGTAEISDVSGGGTREGATLSTPSPKLVS